MSILRLSYALLVAAVLASSCAAAGMEMLLRSPDNKLTVSVVTGGRLTYSIKVGKAVLLSPSPLGIAVDGVDLGDRATPAGETKTRTIDESYPLVGNHPQARNHCYETTVPLVAHGKRFDLLVRAYDDGVAIRYVLPADAKRIDGESTAWVLPDGVKKIAWSEFSPCYEGLTHATPLAEVPESRTVMAPVTVQLSGYYLVISEADCENYADMALRRTGCVLKADLWPSRKGWKLARRGDEARPGMLDGTYQGRPASPWRYTLVARDLNGVVNSDLLTNLCPAPAPGSDFSWVRPGRCLWQWWSVGTPQYEDQKQWYDAAAELKWEYYLVDDGWRTWRKPGKDQWALLKEVIDYGKTQGVRSIVWVDSKEMRTAAGRRAYLEKVKTCGADGIKIDFIPDPTADIMQWYLGGIADCAEMKLLVNFHGSVKPSGLRRTFPCDITREAVRGDEYHMSRYKRVMPLAQDVSLPFARPLAGPADITPVMQDPVELRSSRFTWPHEFAQAVVFLSPVTHFADQYKFYVASPIKDLLQELPTVWDETRVLPLTEMGEVVGFARRKGDTWWIGVLNGAAAREVTLPLDFLGRPAQGTLVYDDPKTDAALDRREQACTSTTVLNFSLRPAGGFFARLKMNEEK